MGLKEGNRWDAAHLALRRLYETRVPPGMSQAQFGAEFGIGSQAMVWQYLSGYRPLNYEVAAKFARGLRCTIRDISPEMASSLETEILPVLGRKVRKVATVAAIAILCAQAPQIAEASTLHKIFSNAVVLQVVDLNMHCMRMLRRMRRWLTSVLTPLYQFVQI